MTHVNAHGTSTPANDGAEAEAITEVFGTPGPAVTSIKGITGHSLGAAGSLEAVALALSMHHRAIPPTAGLTELDPAMQIDVVTGRRPGRGSRGRRCPTRSGSAATTGRSCSSLHPA